MPRPHALGPLEETPDYSGDAAWRGVKMQWAPDQLPPGFASNAVNMRFRTGEPETRYGSMVITWLNNIVDGTVQPWGTVYGVGVFRDPINFVEYVLVATASGVFACAANNAPVAVALPAGDSISARCTFIQCFNVVVLLRGFADDPLVLTDLNLGFQTIDSSPAGIGLLTIPRSLRAVFIGNRLWLAREDDTIVASDLNDYTHYSALADEKINQGEADRIVQLATFGTGTIIVLKERSIYRLDNVLGDLGDVTVLPVTGRYGCVAADSVVDCGSDMVWLSQEGVASLTLTTQNEIQAAQGALSGKYRMFSEDIGPVIDRIKGSYKQNAFGALWNDRYYLALPIDAAQVYGPELVPTGWFSAGGLTSIQLTIGSVYIYEQGPLAQALSVGATLYTTGRVFTATNVLGNIHNGVDAVDGSIRELFTGVNNGLAHYDFQTAAWGGYDEAEQTSFKFVFVGSYLNRQRLFVVTHDGYVRIWEEDYTDRLAQPYADLSVASTPAAGNTVRVNGGTLVHAVAAAANGAPPNDWGISVAVPFENLWSDGFYGYYAAAATVWTSPGALPRRMGDAIRFYSTNGAIPTITTTGTWASVIYTVEQQIVTQFESRGYSNPEGELNDYHHLLVDMETWHPSVDITVESDGVNEDIEVISALTKDRTAYYFPFDAAPYDITNVNNDFPTAGRQDYSIQPDDDAFEFTPGDGVRGDLMQAVREPFEITLAGRSALVSITNRQGRIRLSGLRLSETVDDQAAGPIAS